MADAPEHHERLRKTIRRHEAEGNRKLSADEERFACKLYNAMLSSGSKGLMHVDDIIARNRILEEGFDAVREIVANDTNRPEFLRRLGMVDDFQLGMAESLDGLEDGIKENIVMAERFFPASVRRNIGCMGTFAAYSVALLRSF